MLFLSIRTFPVMRKNFIITAFMIVLAVVLAVSFGGDRNDTIEAEVTYFDFFPNAHLDITMEDLAGIGVDYGDDVLIVSGDQSMTAVVVKDYTGVACYEGFVIVRDDDTRMGSFNYEVTSLIQIEVGDVLTISKVGRNPYLDKIPNYTKAISGDPNDFPSAEVFCNFRMVDEGGVIPGLLYRSASSWSSGTRAGYADALYRENGVESLICIDAAYEEMEAYVDAHPELYTSELFRQHKVSCDAYKAAVHINPEQTKLFLDTFLESEGPIGLSCKLGKDRTGMYCALLEGLAGATYVEVRSDFMESICNFCHIEEGSEEYETVAFMYVDRELYLFNHYDEIQSIPDIDWRSIEFEEFDPEPAFTNYLIHYVGADPETVQAVKDKLRGNP